MEKHFMIDIESTGIDPLEEQLLSIGLLELVYDGGFWRPGKEFEAFQHTSRVPESEFAKKHMTDLYARCALAPRQTPIYVRGQMLRFFKECGSEPPNVYLMGWNASNFDIPFLVHHGYLEPPSYRTGRDGKDIMVGDFHYRIYELGGALSLAFQALSYADRSGLIAAAKRAYPMALPNGRREHDAIYDCYVQTQILNGLISLLRASMG